MKLYIRLLAIACLAASCSFSYGTAPYASQTEADKEVASNAPYAKASFATEKTSSVAASKTSSAKVARLELPAIKDGELVITYKGYSDICYGNPEEGAQTVSNQDKIAYTVSYDTQYKIPRWVAYDLTEEELKGVASRKGLSFKRDSSAGSAQADNYDYRNSGWDKGHLAPAADFKWSRSAMSDTFLYTNCCPQTPYFNGTAWEKLEARVRKWAARFGTVYVVTGPIIGDMENGRLGENRVAIPDAFFKALLVCTDSGYSSVAFVMHNISTPQPYTECSLTVNELESLTGIDFFTALDDSVEEAVEGTVNRKFWEF